MSLPTARSTAFVLLALLGLGLAGCGGGGYGDDDTGFVFVRNSTYLTFPEDVDAFFIAPAGYPFGANELFAPLPPADEAYIGEFYEDFYDGEAHLEFGDIVEYFDVFVGDGDDTVFDVV
jgi:hypothetical protein